MKIVKSAGLLLCLTALLLAPAGRAEEEIGKKIERDAKRVGKGAEKAARKAGKSAGEVGRGTAKALERLKRQLGGSGK